MTHIQLLRLWWLFSVVMKNLCLVFLMLFSGTVFGSKPLFKDCLESSDTKACNEQKLEEFQVKATRLIKESVGYQIADNIYFRFKVDENGKLKVLESFALLSKVSILNVLPTLKAHGEKMVPTTGDEYYEWRLKIDFDTKFSDFPPFDNVDNYPEIEACRSFNEKGERACFRYVVYSAQKEMTEEGVSDHAHFRVYLKKGEVALVEALRLPLTKTLADRVAITITSQIDEMTTPISRSNADDFFVEIEFNAIGDSLTKWKKNIERLDYLKNLQNKGPFVEELLIVRKANFGKTKSRGNTFLLEQLKKVGLDTISRIETSLGSISLDSLRNFEEYEIGNEDDVKSFGVVESVPVWKGCEKSLGDNDALKMCFNRGVSGFVGKNFNYPEKARKKGIQGRAFVSFVVEKDGSVSSVDVLRGVHILLDLESIRVISELPDLYKPAIQRGEPVRISFVMPINAKLK